MLFVFLSANGMEEVGGVGFGPMAVPSSSSSAGGGGCSWRYRAIRGQNTRDTVLRRGGDGRGQDTHTDREKA